MSNKNRNQSTDVADATPTVAVTPTPEGNFTLTYRRAHPKQRVTYGVEGNPGVVVFDLGLLEGGLAPDFVPPTIITLDGVIQANGEIAKEPLMDVNLVGTAACASAAIRAESSGHTFSPRSTAMSE